MACIRRLVVEDSVQKKNKYRAYFIRLQQNELQNMSYAKKKSTTTNEAIVQRFVVCLPFVVFALLSLYIHDATI